MTVECEVSRLHRAAVSVSSISCQAVFESGLKRGRLRPTSVRSTFALLSVIAECIGFACQN